MKKTKNQVSTGMVVTEKTFLQRVVIDWKRNKWKYILLIPVLLFFLIFCYKPMYGIIIAFKNYKPTRGIADSQWVGLTHFITSC